MTDSRAQQGERWPGEAADQAEQDKHTTWSVRGLIVDTAPHEPIMLVIANTSHYRRYLTAEEAQELGSYLIAASLISLGYTP